MMRAALYAKLRQPSPILVSSPENCSRSSLFNNCPASCRNAAYIYRKPAPPVPISSCILMTLPRYRAARRSSSFFGIALYLVRQQEDGLIAKPRDGRSQHEKACLLNALPYRVLHIAVWRHVRNIIHKTFWLRESFCKACLSEIVRADAGRGLHDGIAHQVLAASLPKTTRLCALKWKRKASGR